MDTELQFAAARVRRREPDSIQAGQPQHIDAGWRGHWLMVWAQGDISAATAAALRARLRSALDESPLAAVNMSAARLCDASGLAVLVGVHRHAQVSGRVFLVVAPTSQASAMLRVTGLEKRLLICPTFTDFLTWSGTPRVPHG
jgi:anti-sigma B factor antagonist